MGRLIISFCTSCSNNPNPMSLSNCSWWWRYLFRDNCHICILAPGRTLCPIIFHVNVSDKYFLVVVIVVKSMLLSEYFLSKISPTEHPTAVWPNVFHRRLRDSLVIVVCYCYHFLSKLIEAHLHISPLAEAKRISLLAFTLINSLT